MNLDFVHLLYRRLGSRFRRRRMELFLSTFRPGPATRILDAGGRQGIWETTGLRVTILNTEEPGTFDPDLGMDWVVGSACEMPFDDGSFDIAFSNSLIEHLGGREQRRRFAAEVHRVGRSYWIQTPSRTFPIEPHFLAPFFHWLPRPWRLRVLRFTPWVLLTHASPADALEAYHGIELVSFAELRGLFPEAVILREKTFGMTKSLVAVWTAHAPSRASARGIPPT